MSGNKISKSKSRKVKQVFRRDCTIRKEHVDFHITEISRNDIAMPVDYTYKRFKQIEETRPEDSRRSRFVKPMKGKHEKFLSRTLWLNHNSINNIKNIDNMVNSLFEYPERLAFLDLSRNQVKEIDDSIFKLKNLKVLYLHDNQISDLEEVFKLRQMKRLHNLTLYANPLYENKRLGNSRTVVKYLLPQILKLDYSTLFGVETQMPVAAVVVRFLAAKEGRLLPYIPNKIKDMKELDESNKSKSGVRIKHGPPLVNVSCICCPNEIRCCSN